MVEMVGAGQELLLGVLGDSTRLLPIWELSEHPHKLTSDNSSQTLRLFCWVEGREAEAVEAMGQRLPVVVVGEVRGICASLLWN